nr:unnamed protein product [Digitaria exilis]
MRLPAELWPQKASRLAVLRPQKSCLALEPGIAARNDSQPRRLTAAAPRAGSELGAGAQYDGEQEQDPRLLPLAHAGDLQPRVLAAAAACSPTCRVGARGRGGVSDDGRARRSGQGGTGEVGQGGAEAEPVGGGGAERRRSGEVGQGRQREDGDQRRRRGDTGGLSADRGRTRGEESNHVL